MIDEVAKFAQNFKTLDDLGKIRGLRRMILHEGRPDAVLVVGYWPSGADAWIESDVAFKKRIQEVLNATEEV